MELGSSGYDRWYVQGGRREGERERGRGWEKRGRQRVKERQMGIVREREKKKMEKIAGEYRYEECR